MRGPLGSAQTQLGSKLLTAGFTFTELVLNSGLWFEIVAHTFLVAKSVGIVAETIFVTQLMC
jgi:hypothetical protein